MLHLTSHISAQPNSLNIISAISHVNNYFYYEGNVYIVGEQHAYNPRIGTKLGMNFNKNIYKKLSLDLESGYSLSGFRFRNGGFLSDKLYDVHQIYFALSPQYNLFNHLNIGAGLLYNNNLSYKEIGYKVINKNSNLAYCLNISYQINKWGIGIRYLDFMTPYNKATTFQEYWRLYELTLSYAIKSF